MPSVKRAAVIGHPVKHSLSPLIFSEIAQHRGAAVEYSAIDVTPPRLKKTISGLAKKGYSGVNVTLPLKTVIPPHLDRISEDAKAIGAVNAVKFSASGTEGYNTDWKGFLKSLKDAGVKINGKTALVFGAGGAARAVCYALARSGASKIIITGRTYGTAAALAEYFGRLFPGTGFSSSGWETRLKPGEKVPHLWVNATPIGQNGKEGKFPFVKCSSTAIDLVYGSCDTSFLRQAREHGLATINGSAMLVNQAVLAWRIFFGSPRLEVCPKNRIIRMVELHGRKPVALLHSLRRIPSFIPTLTGGAFFARFRSRRRVNTAHKKNIYLAGFMGAGKSTAGKLLAGKLGLEFVETDALIEKLAGTDIRGIFSSSGERKFREMEEKIIRKISLGGPMVAALGGGALLSASNRRTLQGTGIIVYLKCPLEILAKRLADSKNRPLLRNVDGKKLCAEIKRLLKKRLPYYKNTDLIVDAGGNSPAGTVGRIIASIDKKFPYAWNR